MLVDIDIFHPLKLLLWPQYIHQWLVEKHQAQGQERTLNKLEMTVDPAIKSSNKEI